jgi:hypothetical protein
MEETMLTAVDDRLRVLDERLASLTKALALSPINDAGAGDPGKTLLAEADAHLGVVTRLATLLDERRDTWDQVDQATAAVLLKDLALACRALRRTAAMAAKGFDDAESLIRKARKVVDALGVELDAAPEPPDAQ